jgi:ABC-type uncharacterized transport system ATPase subunit
MSHVEFQGVSKSYPIYDSPGDRLKELITPRRYQFTGTSGPFAISASKSAPAKRFASSENGSGKSTLLQMVAGILPPSAGTVSVSGRVSALLSSRTDDNELQLMILAGTIFFLWRKRVKRRELRCTM